MTKQSNILVIGGTGKTGRKVVEGLKQQNQNVRIGSRSSHPSFQLGRSRYLAGSPRRHG
jgi:nucleoside-diphosphate-sugar epimerase